MELLPALGVAPADLEPEAGPAAAAGVEVATPLIDVLGVEAVDPPENNLALGLKCHS